MVICPRCHSHQIQTNNYGKQVGSAIGMLSVFFQFSFEEIILLTTEL